MESYTFDETAERLNAYEQWAHVVSQDGGRTLYEGPDAERAKPLVAPRPMENLKGREPGRYTIHQLYDAYNICRTLGALVQRGNHLFSQGPGEDGLRPELQLEFMLSHLSRR